MNEVTNNDRLALEPKPEPFTLTPRRNRGVPPDQYSPKTCSLEFQVSYEDN